jgi:excisionase family DNA binding protein
MTEHDVAETARLLGVSERTVRRWLRDGRLTGYRVGGRVRIPDRAVREAARPYGTAADGALKAPPTDADPLIAWLTGPGRLRERRRRAAAIMDEIRARTKPPSGPDDTVEAYIRQDRAERDARWDR